MKVKTAIFPVGGLGTRFLPATKSLPKEMLPIANKPLIQYAFEEACDAGIEKFIFITGRNKNTIANHFDHSYELESKLDEKNKGEELKKVIGWMPQAGQIAFVRQQKPLGLGHAVWCARNYINKDETFAVILADELLMPSINNSNNLLKKMIEELASKPSDSSIIGVDEVDFSEVNKYGIIKNDGSEKIIDMVEKPSIDKAPSNLAIIGRYILQPKIFEYLEKFQIGSGGEIQLTDSLCEMSKEYPFFYKKNTQKRFDCGNVLGYLEANLAFALNDNNIANEVKKIIKKYQE